MDHAQPIQAEDNTVEIPSIPGDPISIESIDAISLLPATTYYVHLRTNCGLDNYSNWTQISFATLGDCIL